MSGALALDIGGANLKAARLARRGGRVIAWSRPFALWREPANLARALRQVARVAGAWDRLLVTMTGELCDCFADKAEGVRHIVDACERLAGRRPVRVWSVRGEWLTPTAARRRWLEVAAANWHAQATWVARRFPAGTSVLIDTGSTTTDVIRLRDGRVSARGLTDTARLASGELIYIGAHRTPLCALGEQVAFQGAAHATMAEFFATMSDAMLLIGAGPERQGSTDTPDGRPMTKRCAAARVLRMVGADTRTASPRDARRLADAFVDAAAERIANGIRQVVAGRRVDRFIVSGSGEWLARRAIARLPARARPRIVVLSRLIGADAATGACATALLMIEDDVTGT